MARTSKAQPKEEKEAPQATSSTIMVNFVMTNAEELGLPQESTEFASRKRLRKWLRNKGLSIKNFEVTVDGANLTLADKPLTPPVPTEETEE